MKRGVIKPADMDQHWFHSDYESVFTSWAKVFRSVREFRILRLTFHRSQPQNAEFSRLL